MPASFSAVLRAVVLFIQCLALDLNCTMRRSSRRSTSGLDIDLHAQAPDAAFVIKLDCIVRQEGAVM